MAKATKAQLLGLTLLPGEVILDVVGEVANLLTSSTSVRGSLCVTSYRVVFTPEDRSLSRMIRPQDAEPRSSKMRAPSAAAPVSFNIRPSVAAFELPHAVINTIDRNESVLTLTCKDTRLIRLDLRNSMLQTPPRELNLLVRRMQPPPIVNNLFAFEYSAGLKAANVSKGDATADTNGWLVYSPVADYKRLGLVEEHTESSRFRFLNNPRFRFSPTYPQTLVVPVGLNEDQLVQCARMRVHARLPVAIWRHPENNSVLVRSSDPTYGLFRKRCAADELLLRCYRDAGNRTVPLYVMYVRAASLMASGVRIGGKGLENSQNYDNAELRMISIQSYQTMRKSFEALKALANSFKTGDRKYHHRLENTEWLTHIMDILSGAHSIAQTLHDTGASVLVHGSDGWDRTTQLTSLAQLLLDPEYRTIRGFAILVEKEWCSFGHKFTDRTGVGKDSADKPAERSPVMLQFLDCVWQMTQQFPTSFEFNERFLIHISDALISGLYGTFLYNSERERVLEKLHERSESVWTPVLNEPGAFTNPSFRPSNRVLSPRIDTRRIVLWESMYYRWDLESRSDDDDDLLGASASSLARTSPTSSVATDFLDNQKSGDTFRFGRSDDSLDEHVITKIVLRMPSKEAIAVFKTWILGLQSKSAETSEVFSFAPVISAAMNLISQGGKHGQGILYHTDCIPKDLRDILLYCCTPSPGLSTFRVAPIANSSFWLGRTSRMKSSDEERHTLGLLEEDIEARNTGWSMMLNESGHIKLLYSSGGSQESAICVRSSVINDAVIPAFIGFPTDDFEEVEWELCTAIGNDDGRSKQQSSFLLKAAMPSNLSQTRFLGMTENQDELASSEAVVIRSLTNISEANLWTIKLLSDRNEELEAELKVQIPENSKPDWFISEDAVRISAKPFSRGSYGTAHRGTWGIGTKVVVKRLLAGGVTSARAMHSFMREVQIWHQLNHPNVIKLYGACHSSSLPFFVCEDAVYGNLDDYLFTNDKLKTSVWRFIHQAAIGLAYLHGKKIVHGDLKCNNILVGADKKAKLADFGLSFIRSESKTMSVQDQTGAIQWVAPEVLSGEVTNPLFASDVYSLGMCIIEAFTEQSPWKNNLDIVVMHSVKAGELPRRPAEINVEAWTLVKKMCARDRTQRMALDEVVKELQVLAEREEDEEEDARMNEIYVCRKCYHRNVSENRFCGSCGDELISQGGRS